MLTIIGAGKMGEALAKGILHAGLLTRSQITFTDVSKTRLQLMKSELGVLTSADNTKAVSDATVVILAVKPKDVLAVCREISPSLRSGAAVVSIVAGMPLRRLSEVVGRTDLVLARAMPNTPCLVGEGAIGLSFSEGAAEQKRLTIVRLLESTGIVTEVPESLLDAVTGLSGSGPAYVAIFLEALADGGVLMGLPRPEAQKLALQTVLGTAKLIAETEQHPGQVKDAVSSPAGTTIAGIAALEEAGFRNAAISAVKAATLRSKELSKD